MQQITILSESCEKALSLAPELKKRCIEEAAAEIKQRLDVNISTSINDNGHRIPKRRIANSKGYRPRIRAVAVAGRFFYRKTEQECADVLVKKAEQICEELVKALEGK